MCGETIFAFSENQIIEEQFFSNEVHIKKLVIIKYLRAIVAWFVELLDMKLKSNTEDDTVFLVRVLGFNNHM